MCILEFRSRFEDFFGGSTSLRTSSSAKPHEEAIFMSKTNPFDSNVVASLGRSSNNNQGIPKSTIFVVTTTPQSTTTVFVPPLRHIPETSQTTRRFFATSTTTVFVPPLHHTPETTPITRRFFATSTTTTEEPIVVDNEEDLLEIDADSGDPSKAASTTVRANVFSSSNEGEWE